ncbi:MAG TPA: ATP-binding cassette domain-containing protein [Bryobacteraceae bacterium]|nr:ATP-binding cassette domain-containing protein [Bryobacteraceae bacterium]
MSTPLLELRNVTIFRGTRPGLENVSLSIALGEHVAILGPNGSGKSTFIQAVTRELYPRYPPPACEVRILGRDTWNVFDLRPLLGIVTNDLATQCTQPYSVRETVLSGFFSSIGIWPNHHVTPEMHARADELMDLLDITRLADRPVNEMSSGEVRRAVIARALVHDPKALVLDEPSNSLDLRAQSELRDTTRKLAAAGLGILLVTHHLPDIIPEIDRVICLRDGRIFRDGPKNEILTEATLRDLFGVPLRVERRDGYYVAW